MNIKKQRALANLYAAQAFCSPCPFGKQEERHKVFGEGNPDANLMFIGEAPGADEDRLKRPFVGRAGKLLNKLIEQAGFSREDVFITNIVKCRPPNNRTPMPNEISPAMKQLLKQEIAIVRPRVICTLGAVATQLFFPHPITMSKVRGKPLHFPQSNITLFPAFHPAYALRNHDAEKVLARDIIDAFELANK